MEEDHVNQQVSPYKERNKNNYYSSIVDLEPETVPDAMAACIEQARPGLPVARVWRDFRHFNRAIKRLASVPLSWLRGFARVWQDRNPDPVAVAKPAAVASAEPLSPEAAEVAALARPADARNHQFHRADLLGRIGDLAYRARVQAMALRYRCCEFTAMLAVHGAAVAAGEIPR